MQTPFVPKVCPFGFTFLACSQLLSLDNKAIRARVVLFVQRSASVGSTFAYNSFPPCIGKPTLSLQGKSRLSKALMIMNRTRQSGLHTLPWIRRNVSTQGRIGNNRSAGTKYNRLIIEKITDAFVRD